MQVMTRDGLALRAQSVVVAARAWLAEPTEKRLIELRREMEEEINASSSKD